MSFGSLFGTVWFGTWKSLETSATGFWEFSRNIFCGFSCWFICGFSATVSREECFVPASRASRGHSRQQALGHSLLFFCECSFCWLWQSFSSLTLPSLKDKPFYILNLMTIILTKNFYFVYIWYFSKSFFLQPKLLRGRKKLIPAHLPSRVNKHVAHKHRR